MTITKKQNGTTLEIALEGRLDTMTAPELEAELKQEGYKYVLGSVLNQVLLHQSVIGQEAYTALKKAGVKPTDSDLEFLAEETKTDVDFVKKTLEENGLL